MPTVTIPKGVTKGTELIVLTRKDYERLLSQRTVPEYRPTIAEKRVLARARKNRAAGRFLTIDELTHKLGLAD
ncbi:MAG: hypothetical protein A3C11_01350 [Candidatus Sungbacteria bacterium RIFCSPHIGHO2_02_FULL_49_12]|uniref:Uncharacterized protein n=1 Tax=Candidatus Sungbacteria bacterium RIFCSPHIGHO2_02_FULL_49_12 TaxID=1802271 RepID=A0A1G2KQY8_9BACT|nr:MAG: hypothetical protein A3C11_01350 [Candidatus Sungbacteria bacterium RIFCSPHIGHO2_02_FULL_49_12]